MPWIFNLFVFRYFYGIVESENSRRMILTNDKNILDNNLSTMTEARTW